jgi:hypothetical protein
MKFLLNSNGRIALSLCLLLHALPADARGEVPIPGLPPATVPVSVDDGLFHSEASLNTYLESCGYDVGYYAVDLAPNRVLQRLADREVCLASMVKVFCLTELFRQAEAGLNLDATTIEIPGHGEQTLRQAADLMIGVSDNPATQALANYLGRDRVNAIPKLLGIEGISSNVLPEESRLHEILDERVQGERQAAEGLPMHGTARAVAEFYEQLYSHRVISPQVSRDLLSFFERHPKPFSREYREAFAFAGKGGNILWTRPPRHYSMMGWGLLLTDAHPEIVTGDNLPPIVVRERGPIALCVWGEWFPPEMSPQEQETVLARVTDSLIATMEAPQRAAKRLEPAITLQL